MLFRDLLKKSPKHRAEREAEEAAALSEVVAERRRLLAQIQPLKKPTAEERKAETAVTAADRECDAARAALETAKHRYSSAYNAHHAMRWQRQREAEALQQKLDALTPQALRVAELAVREAENNARQRLEIQRHEELKGLLERIQAEAKGGDCANVAALIEETARVAPKEWHDVATRAGIITASDAA